ncbi:Solute carrier family 2 [Phytophthora citrophthora]|uniref:Solute carrier family 2 n=1 Tax=Phytophthora citrophthora TaxID=4793 RepID=A0AAD9FXJ0_9STRA|nr:Solute carrier family 2 [Phytophthora citrophthora]
MSFISQLARSSAHCQLHRYLRQCAENKSVPVSPVDPAYAEVATPEINNTMLEPEDMAARLRVQPTYILYTSAMLAFVLPLQYGWSTSQLNLHKFNNVDDCNARPVAEGTCIMFPGHTKFQWTIVVNAWIFGGMIGAFFVGKFADRFGRKQVLIYNCGFIVAGAVIMASVSNLWIFAVGQTCGGYINEISPPHLRSLLGVFPWVAFLLVLPRVLRLAMSVATSTRSRHPTFVRCSVRFSTVASR